MGKEWTEKLREKMQDYQEAGPEGLWEAISEAMDNAEATSHEARRKTDVSSSGIKVPADREIAASPDNPSRTERKIFPVKFRKSAGYIATALSAAAAILLVIYFSFRTPSSPQPHPDNAIAVITPAQNSGQDSTATPGTAGTYKRRSQGEQFQASGLLADNVHQPENPTGAESQGAAGQNAGNATASTVTPEPAAPESVNKTGRGTAPVPTEISGNDDSTAPVPADIPETDAGTGPDNKDKGRDEDNTGNWGTVRDAERPARNRRRGTIHAGLSVSNVTGTSSSYAGYAGLASASMLSSRQNAEELIQTGNAVMLKSASSPAVSVGNTEITHRQPVRAGVSFRYDFTKRWGVETGLTYSLLSSSISSSDSYSSFRTEQKLHYIGIPLQLSYDFLQTRWVSLYANAGGMMEKCVSGRADTDYMSDGNVISESRSDIQVRPLQWSLNAALGAEVHFTPLVGLYVEPGVSYFFNDGSDISTIYKERPVNFNLEFGLRFSFR